MPSGDEVNVDPQALLLYSAEMAGIPHSGVSIGEDFALLGQRAMSGLGWPDLRVGVLREGAYAAEIFMHRQAEFARFLADVTNGIGCVAEAAVVVGEMYVDADDNNAIGIDEVGFAFAEPGAAAPSDFRDHTLISQQDGLPGGGRVEVDESVRPSSDHHMSDTTVIRTTHYDDKGNWQSTTVVESYRTAPGATVQMEKTLDENGGVVESRIVTTNPDGSVTATTAQRDEDGNMIRSEPEMVVQPGSGAPEDTSAGPLDQALDQFGFRPIPDRHESISRPPSL